MPSLFVFCNGLPGRDCGMPTWRRIAMDRLKCVVDAALDGCEDAHEGVVVVAIVVVGDL